jgi:hypothetical protein
MTSYGMPYFLEDKSGNLTGSEFIDIHDRMRLSLRCTISDSMHSGYMVFDKSNNTPSPGYSLVALDFGPANALGTVSFGTGTHVPMKQYLVKGSGLGRYVEFYGWRRVYVSHLGLFRLV